MVVDSSVLTVQIFFADTADASADAFHASGDGPAEYVDAVVLLRMLLLILLLMLALLQLMLMPLLCRR